MEYTREYLCHRRNGVHEASLYYTFVFRNQEAYG